MKYLVLLVSLSFIGMAVFGFAGMASDMEDGHASCIAIALKGNNCPEGQFAFSIFHIEALKTFSIAVFAAMVLFSAVGLFDLFSAVPILPDRLNSPLDFIFEKNYSVRDRRIMRWFSLHEASPHLI